MKLPGHQIEYLKKVRKDSKKVVLVLTCGSPVEILHELADAVILAGPRQNGEVAPWPMYYSVIFSPPASFR